jgi:L-fucose isomerase-like protein
MRKGQPVLGVCPIGKFVFSHEDALRQKAAILEKLDAWKVDYRTVDGVIPDGMVRDQKHVQPVVDHLRDRQVDALFIPHCNFGTEGAAAMIAKKLGVPTLMWAPRDEAPLADGSRYRDSLCGMFATSKVLHKLGVPFSYIENCRLHEPPFRDGLKRFLAAANAVKAMRTMRIAQIGVRVDFFWTTIDNESELLQRFGIEVLPIDMADFLRSVKGRAEKYGNDYANELASLSSVFADPSVLRSPGTINNLAVRDELLDIAQEHEVDAFSIKTFSSMQTELGVGVPIGEMLAEERYPIAAESDIHGAVSSVMLEAAAGVREPSFFPEFTIRHPDNDNGILLWHASGPLSLRHPDDGKLECRPAWILKDLPGASPVMRMKDGPLTVCRFDGEEGEYVIGIGEGKTVDGPPTREVYVWMEVDDWPRWERRLMAGPYIHHCSAIYDHCADALADACRFIPGLAVQRWDQP